MTGATGGVVAVSGASGYVGSLLLASLEERGYRTIALSRNPDKMNGPARAFELGAPIASGLFDGVDFLVHGAWDMTLTNVGEAYRVNVVGSQALIRAARDAGVRRIVFVSSMSAYEGTTQFYGRAKLEVEALVTRVKGMSLRLGLVYGPDSRGMAGALAKLSTLPVVPIPGGRRSYQFLLRADVVGEAFEKALVADSSGVVGVADPVRVSVPDVIRQVGGRQDAKFVGVPWKPLFYAMRLAELAHVRLPIRADSLLGLVRPAPEVPNVGMLGAVRK